MRLMYDAVNSLNIPESAEVVAGYVTGRFTWANSDWNRFPEAVKVRIDVTGGLPLQADVLDVEPGNLGVPQISGDMNADQVEAVWAELCARAKTWVEAREAHHLGSTCYIEASRKNQLASALKGHAAVFWMAQFGISQQDAETLVKGAEIGVQFHSEAAYDVSVIHDDWYPAPKAAAPEAPPAPHITGLVMTAEFTTGAPSGNVVYTYSDGTKRTEKIG